jgi:CDP-diacylglycerol pyrophosphatase
MTGFRLTNRRRSDSRSATLKQIASAILACCALVLSSVLTGPCAVALPLLPKDPVSGSNCGLDGDSVELWVDVNPAKGIKPGSPGTNKEVDWPGGNSNLGYAIHDGVKGGAPYNWLFVPTRRIKGIECNLIWGQSDPKYFNDAYGKLNYIGGGNPGDWALGIESANDRSYDQMHIHMTRLQTEARRNIDTAVTSKLVATTETDWLNKTITVMGNTFRAWNPSNMDHQFFYDLNQNIVTKLQSGWMGNETMLIVANHQGSGFIVLNSDKGLKNGVDNIEKFLYKG